MKRADEAPVDDDGVLRVSIQSNGWVFEHPHTLTLAFSEDGYVAGDDLGPDWLAWRAFWARTPEAVEAEFGEGCSTEPIHFHRYSDSPDPVLCGVVEARERPI